jgi:hypothetical protein
LLPRFKKSEKTEASQAVMAARIIHNKLIVRVIECVLKSTDLWKVLMCGVGIDRCKEVSFVAIQNGNDIMMKSTAIMSLPTIETTAAAGCR